MTTAGLTRLDQTDLELAEGETDIRGFKVVDANGDEIGRIVGLYVDTVEKRVRFLHVRGGGILGLGDVDRLIPSEAIEERGDQMIRLAHARDKVADGPGYDPELVQLPHYWEDVYGWYGYAPYAGFSMPSVMWRTDAAAREARKD